VIDASRARLAEHAPADADAVRRAPPLIGFGAAMRDESSALKRFLFARLYRHPQVTDSTARAQTVVQELFTAYFDGAAELPQPPAARARHRAVADYVAGMTDRYALREHRRITGRSTFEVGL
jgi:dGTPase